MSDQYPETTPPLPLVGPEIPILSHDVAGMRQQLPEIVAAPRPDLVAKYEVFRDAIGPKEDVVYHPCGANDTSPSVAFPDSRVVYAEWGPEGDKLPQANVDALKKAGLEAYFADARTFDSGPVDVLILLNPTIEPDGPASHIVPGGYALVNDYHGTASDLRGNPDFELVGILHDRTPDKKPALDRENPGGYWERVETNEEFRASGDYLGTVMLAKAVTGMTSLSLDDYQRAVQQVRDAHPDAVEMDGMLTYIEDGNMRLFPCSLPRKKGRHSDFFVFQRKLEA